jgi:hypothetical protein
MTKHVRIENADTSDHVVVVETWEKGSNDGPPSLLKSEELPYPTGMATGVIHSSQYLVIKEK